MRLRNVRAGDYIFSATAGEITMVLVDRLDGDWILGSYNRDGTNHRIVSRRDDESTWFVSPEAALHAELDTIDSSIEDCKKQVKALRATRKKVFDKLYPEGYP